MNTEFFALLDRHIAAARLAAVERSWERTWTAIARLEATVREMRERSGLTPPPTP
jgi:hypothetical protein